MGKKCVLSPCKKAEGKAFVNVKLLSNHEISRRLKVSEASVRRIKKKIEPREELSPKRKKKCDRKPIFTLRSERSLKKSCLENRFATTKEAQVNPCNESKASLNWAKQWRDKDMDFWGLVSFSDKSTFEILQNKAQFVCRRRGEKFHSDCVVQTVKHPTKIMISPVISGKGTGRLYVVQARPIKAFLAEQNIPLLDWPGNSPDMNSIENDWELIKREVAKDVITNKTQLLERIIHMWNHPPQMQETVQSFIDSMQRRIEALIAAKCGLTKY
ncbi:putative transposase like protein [Trichonephila clavipes]|nr:putative transposase like protein [Trichonephila clavipes]